MRLVELMSEELILPEVEATTRDAVLQELVACTVRAHPNIDAKEAFSVLLSRERIGSTAIGSGLAIPHAKLQLDRAVTCLARAPKGVEFGALDGQPAHLFFSILAPIGQPGQHLKVLARASRMFMDTAFRARLFEAKDRAALWALIVEKDGELS